MWISWGDETSNFQCDNETFSTTHSYSAEGIYNVTIFAFDKYGNKKQRALGIDDNHPNGRPIIIRNKAPEFTPSVPSSAYEDEEITISVPAANLVESNHDKNTEGLLTYIFDFGDGNSITTNDSSVTHKWTNAGKYPVSITIIDDQGALSQETKYIMVSNKKPEAAFTVGGEIPSTWSFSNDINNRIPFGWTEDASASRDAIKVIQGLDSHSRVLEISGNTDEHPEPRIRTNLGNQYYGTVEYWFQTNNVTKEWGYLSLKSGTTEAISVFTYNSKWCYRVNGGSAQYIDTVADPKEDVWTHVRIDYIVDTSYLPEGSYFGLEDEDEFQVIIDGVISDEYSFGDASVNNINTITIGSHTKSTYGKACIDSIGTTSDPTYEVGMNYNYFLSSYYATHDFRHDIIGKQPSGFEIDALDAETTGRYFGTDSFQEEDYGQNPSGWDYSAGPGCKAEVVDHNGHKTAVKLEDTYEDANVRITYNFNNTPTEGYIEFWWCPMSNQLVFFMPRSGSKIAFKIFTYAYSFHENCYPRKSYQLNRWYHFSVYFDCTTHIYKWWVDGEYIDESPFFDATVSSIDRIDVETYGVCEWYSAYFDAFGFEFDDPDYNLGDNKYSGLDIKVVDEGGDYREVVKLIDKEIDAGVKMTENFENTYGNQTSGTIQWHVKSDNTYEEVWALTLMDGADPELCIAMIDDAWQYSLGSTFNEISGLPPPQNNTWYPVSLTFNGDTDEFTLTVNGTTSGAYSLSDSFDKISKLVIESGNDPTGIAWFDALGYSFDPLYQIDDYLISMISYPEKTNVQFSAADSTDTESDLNSLRYYWQFGDNTSGYGKYITHEYKTSGRYNVSLAVKDDNGEIDYHNQVILIHNSYPEIDIICQNATIEVYEGQTIALNCISTDNIVDWAELMYFWDFNSSMGILSESEYETGGWRKTHLFTDDFEGNAGVLVKDPEGATDMSYANVIVKNINPLVSIYDASVISNITFEVYRNSISKDANFTIDLYADETIKDSVFLTFDGSEQNSIYSNKSEQEMTLSRIWKLVINSSKLPSDSWFRYYIKLNFLDGQELIISSEKFNGDGSNYGEYEVELNPYFYDAGNYHFMYPITLDTQIWDPSIDDVNLTLSFSTNYLLEINCSNSLPIEHNYTEEFSFGTVNYTVKIFLEDSIIYANITAFYEIASDSFTENQFPVDLKTEYIIYPFIDLYDILEQELSLTQLTIFRCLEADNYITANITDDDLGSTLLTIVFDAEDEIEFVNLCPELDSIIPENGSTSREINFYLQISDFDQVYDLDESCSVSFKGTDVPTVTNDFDLTKGAFDETSGDLIFQDNSIISIDSATKEIEVEIAFELNGIGDDEIVTYLSLIYALKCDKAQEFNISLYNFANDTFDLIESKTIGANIYENKYNVLSSEYFNSTYDLIVKIVAKNSSTEFELTIDVLKIEFFSTLISDDNYFEYSIIPEKLIVDEGVLGNKGDYTKQDNDYTVIEGDYDKFTYFGNYTFQNDDVDSDPDGWTTSEPSGTSVKVISQVGDREKVVEMYDNSGNSAEMANDFPTKRLSGIIEFWIRTTDSNKKSHINLLCEDDRQCVQVVIESGNLYYYDGSTNHLITACSNNQWYQIAIEFDCIEHKSNVYLNRELQLEDKSFTTSDCGDGLKYIRISSRSIHSGYYTYYDDFLYYDTAVHYNSTFSFEDDTVGTNPNGWTISEGGARTVNVRSSLDGHDKIVELYDGDGGNVIMEDSFSSQTYGTVEYFFRSAKPSENTLVILRKDSTEVIWVRIDDNKFQTNPGGSPIDLCSASAHQWYHVRIDFCSDSSQYQGLNQYKYFVYIDGTKYGEYSFISSQSSIDNCYIISGGSTAQYVYFFVDAIGYSFDSEYNIGDNKAPFRALDASYLLYLDGPQANCEIESVDLLYSYRTNISTDIDFKIFNYTSNQYQTLDSSVYTNFSNNSYSINPDFYNEYYYMRLRFGVINNSDYKLYIDMLRIDYSWYKDGQDLSYSNIPTQPDDFTLLNNTSSDWAGDLSEHKGDFKVLRGTTIINSASTTATITEGIDYELESGQDETTCFIRITNTRLSGMGKISGGGTQNHDKWAVRIQNPDNIAETITFERDASGSDCRISWEILQYTGSPGGNNELIVRDVGTATCTGTTSICDGSSISTISDPDKVCIFITGQYAVTASTADIWFALFTAELTGSGPYIPRFTRGKSSSTADGVSYAVVEFTGSNWADVQRLDISTECSTAWTTSNYNTAYTDITIQSEGGTDLTDYTKAFIHQQFRTDNDATGLDDAGDNVEIISNTHLRIRNSAITGTRNKVVWIIENLQSTGITMSVEHGWFYDGTVSGSEERSWTHTINEINNVDTASLFCQASMDGGGTAFPRGAIDYRLTSTTQITFTESDANQERVITYDVVQWPDAGGYSIFTSENSILNFTADIDLEACHIGDHIDLLNLTYALTTNSSQYVVISLYNYSSNSWYQIKNSTFTAFSNEIYEIPTYRYETVNITSNSTDTIEFHDFFDEEYVIKIKFSIIVSSGECELYLDALSIIYEFTPYYFISNNLKKEDYLDSDYVTFESDEPNPNHFPGTFSFEGDENDSVPDGWVDESGSGCEVKVISTLSGHDKVLELADDSSSSSASTYTTFDDRMNGTVEMWVRMGRWSAIKKALIKFLDEDNNIFYVSFYYYPAGQEFRSNYGGGSDTHSFTWNHWYRLKWTWDTDSFSCWVDNDLVSEERGFINGLSDGIDKIQLLTDDGWYVYSWYFDAIGFNWTDGYREGDFRYPAEVINETIDLELGEMNSHRIGLLDTCKIHYSINTSIIQDVSIALYNSTGDSWTQVDSLTTDSSKFYNGTLMFTSSDYITDDFKVKIRFYAYNQSVDPTFTLKIDILEADYNWSKAHANFGYNNLNQQCEYYKEKSTQYLYWYYANASFEYEGNFLIVCSVDDGYTTSQTGDVVEIIHPEPFSMILPFPNETYEDMIVDFESRVYGSGVFANETRYLWDWGDGYYNYEPNPSHAWATNGTYNISLFVQDCFGNTFTDNATITVLNMAPEIVGPFTFYGVEARAINMSLEVYDSNVDELTLDYRWYNSTSRTSPYLFSTDEQPIVILDDGTYDYALEVEDQYNQISAANISIIVENVAPQAFVANYMYRGAPGEGSHGEEGTGRLNITAYAYDCHYDIGDIKFDFTVYNGTENHTENYQHKDTSCFIYYKAKNTRIYSGVVTVTDASGATSSSTFTIHSFIDSDSDGLSDEFEYQLELYNQTESMYDDDDNDGLINQYEIGITETNITDEDTDNDGLYDGVNNETGIGELSLGTDPRDPDTDDDGLSDSFEFYGWNISTEAYGNITVNSNPCKSDTDDDGLNDLQEYNAKTDPHNPDTDKDGLKDGEDPHPTKWDGDGDGLNDKIEFDIGTNPNSTDTDEDGLTDGQEYYGWDFYTDPLKADSDNDFLSDNAEMKTYKFEREKKAKLDIPISLWVKEHAVRPASAQLAFTISFGEYAKNDTLDIEYGIKNATNLEIAIIKAENDLLIFNTTTNGTVDRYISHVIDLKSFIENLNDTDADIDAESFDYFGEYIIRVNDTQVGCILEQFEIEIAKWLDPNNNDTDGDGIMDGVETGALVRGIDTIDFKDIYWYEERNYAEPQGWWTMDDESKGAGVAEDWSSNENDGDLTNMEVDDWVSGKIGPYALIFDGTNEYVDCDAILEDASTGAFGDNSQEFTVTVWINATDISNAAQSNHGTKNCFIAKAGSSTNDNLEIGVNNDGTIHVYLDTESHDTSANLGTAGDIIENNWTFIAVRYNYGNLTLNIDNKTYESTAWQGGSTDLDAAVGAKFTIGRTMDSSVYFEGEIDDARVYNTHLNDANIEWIYNNYTGQSLKPVSSGAQLTTGNGSNTYDEFQLEIPYIGKIFDANLTLSIKSEETPWGNQSTIGMVEIELIKDELNCSVDDPTLLDKTYNVYDGWDFSKSHFLKLSEYLANGTILEYYGKYILRIEVTDENFYNTYNFTLSEFYIETDTWIQGSNLADSHAWVTDPAKLDTDDDGWNDYYEIFSKGTNPCSEDTDGDGIWDTKDLDPFKDLLIEIKFISGKHKNLYYWQRDPDMEGLVEFKLMGIEMYYITELRKASCDPDEDLLFEPNRKAWFGHKYYVNPPDDYKSLKFRFELWQISPRAEDGSHMGDLRLVAEDYTFTLNYEGYTVYEEFEDEGEFGHDNELKVRIKTLAMERANTIAIYEENSTFVGHYQEQEKMNVIQLWVSDDGTVTPFQKGPNTIVISTSLFSNTKLHSMLEKEQLEQTPLWSPVEGDYQFIAVDRDENSNSDGATNNVDFVIIRRAISSAQAMDVLDLLLTCYVNESIDEATNQTVYEEAKLYTYVSTKINGTKAVKMNLHVDVLGFIPYFSNYKNSEQGQEPDNRSKYTAEFILVVTSIISAIVVCAVLAIYSGGMTALVMIGLICLLIYMLDAYLPGIAEILNTITAVLIELVMTVLSWLGPLGWLILRAVVLAMIWALFAISLIVVNIVFVSIYSVFYALNYLYNFDLELSSNKIVITGDINMTYGYDITMEYSKFLNFDIPKIEAYFDSDKIQFEFKFGLDLDFIGFSKFPKDIINTTMEDWLAFLTSVGSAMGLCGGGFNAIAVTAHLINTDYGVSFSASTLLWIVILIYSVNDIMSNLKNPDLRNPTALGLGIGCIIAAIAAAFPQIFTSLGESIYFLTTGIYSFEDTRDFFKFISLCLKIFKIADLLLWEEISEDLEEYEIIFLFGKCGYSLTAGIVGLISGSYNLLTIPHIIVRIGLALLIFCIGVFFLAIGCA
ncbi:MAG: PKD domain-containing protein [Candidatus Hodarchaeota archaeon]